VTVGPRNEYAIGNETFSQSGHLFEVDDYAPPDIECGTSEIVDAQILI
jgi:hypothetical protein